MTEDLDRYLETKYKLLQTKHEDLCKQFDQSKKDASALQALLDEYGEIIAGSGNERVDSGYARQLDGSKKQLSELQASIEENKKIYENELSVRHSEIQVLISKLDEAKSKSCQVEVPKVDDKLHNKLLSLQEETDELNQKVVLSQEKVFLKVEENTGLLEKVKDLEQDLCHYRELADCENSKLEELNDLLKQVNDDYLVLKTEQNTSENMPLDVKNQGTSLFAEVNTRRVQLHENIQTIKSQYLDMKQQRTSHLNELTELRRSNLTLKNQLKETEEEKIFQQDRIISFLTQEVQTLNILIESYKKEIKIILSETTSGVSGLDLAEFLVAQKDEDLIDLKIDLERKVADNVLLTLDVADQEKEIWRKNSKIEELKIHVSELKQGKNELETKLNTLSLLSNQVNTAQNSLPAEIKKPISIMKTEHVKENVPKGTVDFSQNNSSARSKGQRAVIPVFSPKAVYYS